MEVERVQGIASLSKSLNTIPSEFIRSEHERPGITMFHGPVPEIPIVDLADPDHDRVDEAMVKASQEWGMFQLVNHGIPVEVIKELQCVGKKFFELPQEEKEAYAMKPGAFEGYGTNLQKDLEGKKAWVDFFFHNIWLQSRVNHSMWPKNPPSYRKANEEYTKYLLGVVGEVLASLLLGLGLDKNILKDKLGGEELELLLKIILHRFFIGYLADYCVSAVSKDYRHLIAEFAHLGLFDKKGHGVLCSLTFMVFLLVASVSGVLFSTSVLV